jgi:hypothetical protein
MRHMYWLKREEILATVFRKLHDRSKKEKSYISTPPLGLHGLLLGELYLLPILLMIPSVFHIMHLSAFVSTC